MDDSPAAAPMQPPYLTTPAIRQRLDLLSHLLEFSHQMVVIQGQAGSGRSRLLAAVANQTHANWRVISCNGAATHTAPALLEALSEALELGELDAGIEDLRARLAEIELGGQLCILTLDDAENIDEGARAMLFSLAYSEHQRGDLRVVVAGDADSDFGERLQSVAPEGAVIHVVDVPPLEPEELKTLALSVLPAAADDSSLDEGLDLDALAAAAEGNPGRMLASVQGAGPKPIHPGVRAANAARAMGGALRGFNVRKYAAVLAAAAFVLVAVAIGMLLASRHNENTAPGTVEITLPTPSSETPTVAADAVSPSGPRPTETTSPISAEPARLATTEPPAPAPEQAAIAVETPATAVVEPTPVLVEASPAPSAPAAAAKPAAQPTPHPRPAATKPAADRQAPTKRSSKPAVQDARPSKEESLYSAKWLKRQKPQHYVIQLFGSRERAATTRFIRDHGLGEKATVLEVKLKQAPWFVVVTGLYTTRTAANSAIHAMPASLAKQQPWPRAVSTLK